MENENYTKEDVEKYREELINVLRRYHRKRHLALEVSDEFFNDVLFKYYGNTKTFAIPFELAKKLDLSRADFKDMYIVGMDFTGTYGVKINPQEIAGETLDSENVLFWINNCCFKVKYYSDRNASDSFLKIQHNLSNCIFNGVEFTGPFDNSFIHLSDFTGSRGAYIDPQKLKADIFMIYKKLHLDRRNTINLPMNNCVFDGVEFTGNFDNTIICGSNFAGSNNANISLQTLQRVRINKYPLIPVTDCEFTDANVVGPWYNVVGATEKMYEQCKSEEKKLIKK